MTLPSYLSSTRTKQTTYSLSLTNSYSMLYCCGLIRAPDLSVPASLMRPRRAVLQTPPKSSVPPRLLFYKNRLPLTHSKSTLTQLLIPLDFNSPRINTYKKPRRGSRLSAPKFCNSSLPAPHHTHAKQHPPVSFTSSTFSTSFAFPSVTPFPATLTGHLQLTENPATLSPAFATLARRVKHKSFVCHSYRKHRGWGVHPSNQIFNIMACSFWMRAGGPSEA
jgi:hypothetical protein